MGCVTGHLSYDPTDANSILASHSIGAYVLAGTDGDQIGSETLNSLEWLRTAGPIIDSNGNEVAVTGNALDVNVASGDLTVDLDHTEDSVRLGDGTNYLTSHNVSSDYGLDVYVLNASDIVDGVADTAIENTSTPVSTTAVNVVTSALANRKYIAFANEGNKVLYIGKTGVTTANGYPQYKGEKSVWRIGPSVMPQAIGATGASSEDLRVMELS